MLKIGEMMKEAEMHIIPTMTVPSFLIEFSNTVEKIAILHLL
jgi:hypothetical protein